ncbi:MAG: endonuclease III [Spirochaetaceae bacterium]|nr:endonuclease III [Myxococcales bacterium]MCB9723342.1 endonuclease III [Spirochaetaceae bacterium]
MTRAEKARRILAILDALYPDPPIPLDHEDPFTLLVAVLLSAQTTDERVNRVTPGLFARAKTPEAMSRLGVDEILAEIRSCGLAPAKARNIKALSEILVRDHAGRVPADLDALEALPGVGHKTASVVMIQAFGIPAFPVDTHIHRLAARWGLSDGRSVEKTERDLKAVFPPETWARVHLKMIYFGREHCPARGHDLASCPICGWAASKRRMQEEARAGGGGPASRKALAKEPAAAGRPKAAARKTAAKGRKKSAARKKRTGPAARGTPRRRS